LQGLGFWEILGLGFKESHGHFKQNEDFLGLGLRLGIKLISFPEYKEQDRNDEIESES
jgi:hypothetical protein